MTKAICVHCGAVKIGCLNPCPDCGQMPATRRDTAYSFALSDHYLSHEELDALSRQIIVTRALPALAPETEAAFIEAYGFGLPDGN